MEQLEAIKLVRKRSLLRYLTDDDLQSMSSSMRVIKLETSSTEISRAPIPDTLFIVIEGEVRFDSEAGTELATAGQSLELATLFAARKTWQSIWFANTPNVTLLEVPWSAILVLLKGPLYTYLSRVSQFSELQRVKNDLAICDLPPESIVSVIAGFEEHTDAWIPAGLFVLAAGELRLPSNPKFTLRPGDYVFFEEPLRLGTDEHSAVKFWHLDALKLTKLMTLAKLSLLNTLSRSYTEQRAPKSEPSTAPSTFFRRTDERIPDAEMRFSWLMQMAGRNMRYNRNHTFTQTPFAPLQALFAMLGQRFVPSAQMMARLDSRLSFPSLSAFADIARQLGAETVIARMPLTSIQIPVVVRFESQYMLAYPIAGNRLELSSPSLGKRQLTYQQASLIRPVHALLIIPRQRVETALMARPEPNLRSYQNLVKQHYSTFAMVGLLTGFLFLFALATPFLTQYLFDAVLPGKNHSILYVVLAVLLFAAVFENLIHYVRSYLFAHLITVFDALFSSLVVRAAYQLPLRYFQSFGTGDILTRLNRFWDVMHSLLEPVLTLLITSSAALIYLVVIGFLNLKILAFVILSFGILAAVTWLMTSLVRENVQREYAFQTQAANLMFEHLHAANELRSAGSSVLARWRWESRKLKARETTLRYEGYSAFLIAFSTTFQEAFRISLLLLSIYLFSNDEMTLGQVIAVGTLAHNAIVPVRTLVSEGRFFIEVREAFRAVARVLKFRQEDMRPASGGIAHGEVTLHDLWFQYGDETASHVLQGVSATVSAGRFVAVVGRSGAGKTTLSHLLNGLYLPARGQIYIDRRPAFEYPLSVLRDNILHVGKGRLFRGTVAENICMFRTFDFEDVVEAAKAAEIHDVVLTLRNAYSTRLSEGKDVLTAEQRQKISLARAFLLNPKVLILDECFSFFDDATTKRLVDRLKRRRVGKTTFVMSHNMLVSREADDVLVLDEGKILEQGNHRELIEMRGLYFQLNRSTI